MKTEPQARNVWAPEIFYDAIKKQFMIVWASPDLVRWSEESDRVRFPAGHRHGSVLGVSREIWRGLIGP